MTLLLARDELASRRAIAGAELAPLADSLAADLEPLLARPPEIPRDKARLSRAGGRCPDDGTNLEYDPFAPRRWRCPRCGRVYGDDAHYRYGLMWHHLWLAERAVHGAVLFALRGDQRHALLAESILTQYADVYLELPDRDNVLGPSRVFFSTYLESIWLLQLCVALDFLEAAGRGDAGGRARDRIVAPAAALIAEYDEGTSNRQAWNVAALLAATRLLGGDAARVVADGHGLRYLLDTALLPDGSWYEGENYHVFAHRGLWYGVTMAERAGVTLDPELVTRFDRGFALPFRTALPDFTMLARRDSQWAISLRQWRFAELCELGLARRDDPELRAALAKLYDGSVPRADTARSRSSAEAERHSPASALDRSDLGWRSLLHARPALPPLAGAVPRSVLLPTQGLAVLRRDGGRFFVAVDYGESGGGHGHPDRLNLVLCDGATRWLDDPGTGSYVDRSLHWYRSTLAHCAPLVDRASQPRRPGRLLAWDERGAAGWVAARAEVGRGVAAERRVVAMDDYVVDELSWVAPRRHAVALPIHLDADAGQLDWRASPLGGAGGLEDGFDFVERSEVAQPAWPLRLVARAGDREADVWLMAPVGAQLFRAVAPGAPGREPARFLLLESSAPRGSFLSIVAPRRTLAAVTFRDASVVVEHRDGTVHEHAGRVDGWRVDLRSGAATSSIELGGAVVPREVPPQDRVAVAAPRPLLLHVGAPARELALGENDYRRSEQSWRDAGGPTAVIRLHAAGDLLHVAVDSRTGPPVVIPDDAVNAMDNEQPDVNASGVQLSIVDTRGALHRWLIRPGPDRRARIRPLTPQRVPLEVHVASDDAGWSIDCAIPLASLGDASPYLIGLGVVVNEMPPGRERRRGQLVLGGAAGEWVYLRGDRDDLSKLLPIRIDR